MKHYKLLKDLSTFKAGDLFYISEYGALVYDDGGYGVMAYSQSELDRFPNILTEWFEEIQEPTDSIHWKPKKGEKYFYINEYGDIECETWNNDDADNRLMAMGLIRRTEEKCEEARDRRLAEVRLRRTSDFKPDWKNEKYGYSIFYGPRSKKLFVTIRTIDGGEIVRYATQEEAEKSIKEHEADWKKYFGIKEEK